MKGALKGHSEHWEMRRKVFYNLGPAYEILVVNGGSPIFRIVGADVEHARNLFRSIPFWSKIREPICVARLIARSLS